MEEPFTQEQREWLDTKISEQLATCLGRFAEEITQLSQEYQQQVSGYATTTEP